MTGETFVAAPGSGSTCRCDVHQMIWTYSRSITATRPAISQANGLAVGRWTVRSLFNSSIADAPNRCNFSLIVRSLVRLELSANRKGRCVSLHIDSRGNRLRRDGMPHIAGDGLPAEFGGVYDAAATENPSGDKFERSPRSLQAKGFMSVACRRFAQHAGPESVRRRVRSPRAFGCHRVV
jgi:hypothetical protein